MQILNLEQGSDEWKEVRRRYKVASEAPVIMGASPNIKRDELLHLKSTGLEREINEWVEKFVFKKGHETEALARPIAEAVNDEEFYPLVGVNTVDGLELLASFDGITAPGYRLHWEHKQMNRELFGLVTAGAALPPKIYWQLEHQLLVNGNDHCVFAVSDGTEENYAQCYYESVPERRAQLIEGWKLFDKDLESYVHQEVAQKVEGKTIKELPALVVEISGEVKSSNLAIYQDYALSFIASVNKNLQTDQDFADADNVVKFCERVEQELVVAKKQVLAQAISVNEVLNTIDYISEEHRKTRLLLSKLITTEKESRKMEIINAAVSAWQSFFIECNAQLDMVRMPTIYTDFANAGKGKRTLDTYRSAVNDALAKAKIEANIILKKVQGNIATLKSLAANHLFLFNDAQSLIDKDADAFAAIVKMRIADYDKAIEEEAKREAEAAKAAAQAAAEQAPVAVISSVQPAAPANDEQPTSSRLTFGGVGGAYRTKPIPKSLPTSEQVINAVAMHFNMQSVDAERLLIDLFSNH